MAIEKRDFSNRAARYSLKSFHNKEITYSGVKIGSHKATDFLDISSTGIAFVAAKKNTPDSGAVLRLTFSIPGKSTITVKAQVVRTKTYKRPEWYKRYYDEKDKVVEECFVAVHFLHLNKEKTEDLDIYLDSLIKAEKKERQQQIMTYVKDGAIKSYKWILISVTSLVLLGVSLKLYFG